MAIQQIPRTDPEPDPEAVIYNALAETVSVGLLNLEGDALLEKMPCRKMSRGRSLR